MAKKIVKEKVFDFDINKYEKVITPKWWEWLPLLSFTYEERMSKSLGRFLPDDPDRAVIMKAFTRIFYYTFGISFVMILVTPLLSYLLNRRLVRKILASKS